MAHRLKMISSNIFIAKTFTHGKSYFAACNLRKNNLVFIVAGPIVRVPTIYTIPISYNLFIDPTEYGGKYLCHSCEPNCGIKRRTEIITMRDIRQGEEITIDYAMIVYRYGKEITAENRICNCGSPLCRGKLGAYEELLPELRKKYHGFISEYLTEEKN